VPRGIRELVQASLAIERTGRHLRDARRGVRERVCAWMLAWLEWAAAKLAPVGEEVLIIAERRG
jgi:hypothetical protein